MWVLGMLHTSTDELAALAGTIPYEIMLGFGNRFVREVK